MNVLLSILEFRSKVSVSEPFSRNVSSGFCGVVLILLEWSNPDSPAPTADEILVPGTGRGLEVFSMRGILQFWSWDHIL